MIQPGTLWEPTGHLEGKGFPLDYHEIAGAGHVPVAGGVTVPLTYCLGQSLP